MQIYRSAHKLRRDDNGDSFCCGFLEPRNNTLREHTRTIRSQHNAMRIACKNCMEIFFAKSRMEREKHNIGIKLWSAFERAFSADKAPWMKLHVDIEFRKRRKFRAVKRAIDGLINLFGAAAS